MAQIQHPGARASVGPRPGRRTATPGREEVGRPGARVLMTPSSTSSIGAPAMRSPTIRDPARVRTVCSRRVYSRSSRRPAQSSVTINVRIVRSLWVMSRSLVEPPGYSAGSPSTGADETIRRTHPAHASHGVRLHRRRHPSLSHMSTRFPSTSLELLRNLLPRHERPHGALDVIWWRKHQRRLLR